MPNLGFTDSVVEKIKSLPAKPDGWIEVDLPAINKELGGKDYTSTANAVRRMAERGLLEVRKPHRTKVDAVRFLYDTERGMPIKEVVMGLLERHSNARGTVRTGSMTIARQAGLSNHDLLKVLFDLRRENRITFRKTGAGATLHVKAIKVIRNGKTAPEASEPVAEPVAEAPKPAEPKSNGAQSSATMLSTYRASHYPLILQLRNRKRNIEEAAERLDAAGLSDEAAAILMKVDDLTPFEKEVLSLVDKLGWE